MTVERKTDMKVEIVVRTEFESSTQSCVVAPISIQLLEKATVEQRKDLLDEMFLRAYYEMTGKAFK